MSLPPGVPLNSFVDNWANRSQYVVDDYLVDPSNAVLLQGLANLSEFGIEAAADGAYLYQRGWTQPPTVWIPWSEVWPGGDLPYLNGSITRQYSTPQGPSLYHSPGKVNGALWDGPRELYLPPGNYSVTFNLELHAGGSGKQLKLEVQRAAAVVNPNPLFTIPGYVHYLASIGPALNNSTMRPKAPEILNTTTVTMSATSGFVSVSETLHFSWPNIGYVNFPGFELSSKMALYLINISVLQTAPIG